MFIRQIINNNVVLVRDTGGKELIVVAKGIGYHGRTGAAVDLKRYPDQGFSCQTMQSTPEYGRFTTRSRRINLILPFSFCKWSSRRAVWTAVSRLQLP